LASNFLELASLLFPSSDDVFRICQAMLISAINVACMASFFRFRSFFLNAHICCTAVTIGSGCALGSAGSGERSCVGRSPRFVCRNAVERNERR
jgi:hypothetical protein